MLVSPGNIYTTVLAFEHPEELGDLTRVLSFKQPGYFFTKAFKQGHWDGTICFLRYDQTKKSHYFLSGLITYIRDAGLTVRVKQRPIPEMDIAQVSPTILKTKVMSGPYSYQLQCLKDTLSKKRGVWHLATNSGKTYIAAALFQHLNLPGLFLVHTEDLLLQARDVFTSETNQVVHLLGAGFTDVPILSPGHITVGLINTVFNKTVKKVKTTAEKHNQDPYKLWLQGVRIVISDECHLATASMSKEVLLACNSADYRLGISGTPFECDVIRNMELTGLMGSTISRVTTEQLITLGVAAKPVVHIHKVVATNPSPTPLDGDYPAQYLSGVVTNPSRNNLILRLTSNSVHHKKLTLILVHNIEHGNLLLSKLKDQGIDAEFCHGDTDKEVRYTEISQLKLGKRRVLILSKIGEVGLDIPALDVVIRASGGFGTISTIQSIGRGLRKKTGKDNVVEYHDFYDDIPNHPYLLQHSEQRIEDYRKEGFDVRGDFGSHTRGRSPTS